MHYIHPTQTQNKRSLNSSLVFATQLHNFMFLLLCSTTIKKVIPVASAISLPEVATHNSNTDCWSIVYGNVYDVTSYAPRHPRRGGGADQVYRMCGIDSTSLYDAVHGDNPEWLDEFSSITNLGPVTIDEDPCGDDNSGGDSPCQDYETCLDLGNGEFQCQYQDPCLDSPCEDYEICLDLGYGEFECQYQDPCLDQSSSCQDYETCLDMGNGMFECQYNNPCDATMNPCQEDSELCIDLEDGTFRCEPSNSDGEDSNPCSDDENGSPCQSFEECVYLGSGNYQCRYIDPCTATFDPVPCKSFEQCVDLGEGGFRCEYIDPCATSTGTGGVCESFESCVDEGNGIYHCDYIDPCRTRPCQGNEECLDLGGGNYQCNLIFLDPCLPNPCDISQICIPVETDERFECQGPETDTLGESPTPTTQVITSTELQEHASPADCWVAYHGKVFDLSEYFHPSPPGNSVIRCGADDTKAFAAKHPEGYLGFIDRYHLGILIADNDQESSSSDDSLMTGSSVDGNENPEQDLTEEGGDGINIDNDVVSLLELQMHSTPEDCWVSYFGDVYSLTTYAPRHPVGSGMIFASCGWDGTAEYSKYHKQALLGIIQENYIGRMDPNAVFEVSDGKDFPTALVAISSEELALHNSSLSCWVSYYNEVYDLTTYGHPITSFGQSLIYMSCGKDGTRNYTAVHPRDLLETVEDFKIGWLESSCTVKASVFIAMISPFILCMLVAGLK